LIAESRIRRIVLAKLEKQVEKNGQNQRARRRAPNFGRLGMVLKPILQ